MLFMVQMEKALPSFSCQPHATLECWLQCAPAFLCASARLSFRPVAAVVVVVVVEVYVRVVVMAVVVVVYVMVVVVVVVVDV